MTTPEKPHLAGTLEQTLILSASGRGSMVLRGGTLQAKLQAAPAKKPGD